MDGYLTEYHYLDGISYDPTYFGEFDDNGVWIPKNTQEVMEQKVSF